MKKGQLRLARRERGYTQKDVTSLTGIAQASISQYEGGKRTPYIEVFITLAKLYNVTLDYLVLGRE